MPTDSSTPPDASDTEVDSTKPGAAKVGDRELADLLGMRRQRPRAVLSAGQTIADAYRIERELGAGGMGVVYLARDLRLHRDVAIKVHAAVAAEPGGDRLLREAAALAQLVHPNVVTVHEVGTWTEHPYVVMEYVLGHTARGWCAASARTPQEILRVYVAAGRGLAAAHAAGMIHRDFKPDNVLVGEDGRVRVADFGLARAIDDATATATATATSVSDGTSQASALPSLTATGAVLGTPAYMAPEQRAGASIGPAADQYAYAVSLAEALGDQAPPHVARALARARSETPDARFPSMAALLNEVARDPAAGRRRIAIGVGAVIVVAGLGAGAMVLAGGGKPTPPPRPTACAAAHAALGDTWTPAQRDAVRAAFVATKVAGADTTFARVARRIDTYTTAWTAQRVEACEATQVRGEQSAAMLDLRDHCLDQRRQELAALIEVFGHADARVLATADSAAVNLTSLDLCRDVPRLDAAPRLPDDPAQRAEANAIEALIARTHALFAAGKYAEQLASSGEAVERADRAQLLALAAKARYWQGFAQFASRQPARATFERAAKDAAAAHDDALTADLWIAVLDTLATADQELRAADQLVGVAEAAVVRAGDLPDQRFHLDKVIGGLRLHQGRLDDARAALERALAIGEKTHGKDAPELGQVLTWLGSTLWDLGDHAGARAAYQRDLQLTEAAYGKDHPQVADIVNNLATLDEDDGKYDDARAGFEQALAIKERGYGPDNPALASSLDNLATVLLLQGHADQGAPYIDRALAIVTKAYGPDHPLVARTMMMRAELQVALGQTAAAKQALERALAIQTAAMGDDNPEIASTLSVLAKVLDQRGDTAGAIAQLERGLRIIAKTFGPDSDQAHDLSNDLATLKKKRGHR